MFKDFLYGVCYYPEHWDRKRHESDVKRIAACGFNFVRLGEGAWDYWEPEEGRYQFELFDRVIDLCRKHGLKVVMGTPTYTGPAWISTSYPEVLRWNFDRIPMKHGSRRNFNYTSPKYLELSDKIVAALAEHYKNEKQIVAWQLDNEFNCHMDVSYSPSDTLAFRRWLKDKYKTLDRLNAAWGTRFWAQTYTDWEQADLPHPTPTWMNPSQLLDETRFISDCVIRFAKRQADVLRRHNKKWLITHNALFANIDGPRFVKELDFFSHDQYPLFAKEGDWQDYTHPLLTSRSLSFPFGVLEQQSGPGGQMGYLLRTPRPGQMRLWAWQSIFHGAKLLSYFRWRTAPYGAEQHWHGLLDSDDKDNRRIDEAKQVGRELARLPADFFDAPVVREVAVMRDFDNEANDRRINTYTKSGRGEDSAWTGACGRAHVPVDVVWPTSDLRGYRLLVLPHLKIIDRDLVTKLTQFVEAGGTLVLGAQSGLKDKNCHVVEQTPPGLLRKLAGVEVADWTTLGDDETRPARLETGVTLNFRTFVERLRPRGAEPIGWWLGGDSLLDTEPALTHNRVGKGGVYYFGGYLAIAEIQSLLEYLLATLKIEPRVRASDRVEVIERKGRKARYLTLCNHGPNPERVRHLPAGLELFTGKSVSDELLLPPYAIGIVRC